MDEKLTIADFSAGEEITIRPSVISAAKHAYLNTDALETIRDWTLKKIREAYEKVPRLVAYKCSNCGGALEVDADNHISVCPYCNVVHLVGISHINDTGLEGN